MRAKEILELLEMISEKLYAAADKEISANASDIEITELSKVIETAIGPSTSTSLTSPMRIGVDKAEKALASIRKMQPSNVPTYGTSLNSQKTSTTNEDWLSSSGNKNLTGNETVEPSGSVNGTNIGTSPSNDSPPTLNNVSGNGTEGK